MIRLGNEGLKEKDKLGLTPLHWCCKRNEELMCELFLCFDADTEKEDLFGRTPLDLAIHYECFNI